MGNENMPSFEKDTLTVARALMEHALYWEEAGSSFGSRDSWYCRYCGALADGGGWQEDESKLQIKHVTACPVLVAQDLLAGST